MSERERKPKKREPNELSNYSLAFSPSCRQVEEAPSKENAFDKLHMKAVASCNGDAGCEQVLEQVMGLFGK